MEELNSLVKLSHVVQILAIVLVVLGGLLQASRFYLDRKIDNLKTSVSIQEKSKTEGTINTLQLTVEEQSLLTDKLREDISKRQERISELEKRVNIINSLEIHLSLDEITSASPVTEKATNAGIQSVVGFFTVDKTRIRFVTDFQFSVEQISPTIRRGYFIYKPEDPSQILGKEIKFLDQIEIFGYNFTGFVERLGFNPQNKNHQLSFSLLLNGISIVNIENIPMVNGQLYTGQLDVNVKKIFSDIEKKYQEKISNTK